MNCRYCDRPIHDSLEVVTHSYWSGEKFYCHPECKLAGERAEAMDCQLIDADCNDCRHFQRGGLVPKIVSTYQKDGRTVLVSHQPNVITGRCLKFDRSTLASPKKWSGLECFEHRRL